MFAKIFLIIFCLTLTFNTSKSIANNDQYSKTAIQIAMRRFQLEADTARMQHLVYWTGVIEDY